MSNLFHIGKITCLDSDWEDHAWENWASLFNYAISRNYSKHQKLEVFAVDEFNHWSVIIYFTDLDLEMVSKSYLQPI